MMKKLPIDSYWKFPRDAESYIDGQAARILHVVDMKPVPVEGRIELENRQPWFVFPSGSRVLIESTTQVQLAGGAQRR